MKISILYTSRALKSFQQSWIDEYVKFIRPFAQLELLRLKKIVANKHLPPTSLLILLDVEGQTWSTEGFAHWLSQQYLRYKSLVFVVGDAYGLPDDLVNHPHIKLSLSCFTLPHRLALLILTEQLYRACTVIQGHPYHHAES